MATTPAQSDHDAISSAREPRRGSTLTARPQITFENQRSRTEFLADLVLHMPKSIWAVLDASSVCLGNYIGYQLFRFQFPTSTWVADMTLANAVVALSFVISGLALGLYETETLRHRSRIVIRSLLTIVLSMAISYIVLQTLLYEIYSRRIAILSPLTFIALSGGLRLLSYRLLRNLKTRVLFVGHGASIRRVHDALDQSVEGGNYTLLGYVTVRPEVPGGSLTVCPCLGRVQDIQAVCLANDVHEVVIGAEDASDAQVAQLIMYCLRQGCRVTNQPTFHERVLGEVPTDSINTEWFLFADLDAHREARASVKRAFDFVSATVTLVLTAPLWPIIALAIRISDGGPVFYSQKRVGRHNRIFNLTKFRTMRVDAEVDGHAWAVPDDPRVTGLGRFLRRTHLDELPQLWNILLGDMSFVGPRPERPEFVEELIGEIPYYDERHLVKPGLTGWAQINYRYGCSVADARKKLCLDLYYIKHMSIELDLVIILRTLGALIRHP